MTLAKAAAEAELSHSFLSQVERGLERLSMASLFRIARALGTTQQDLLTGADETPAGQGGARGSSSTSDFRCPNSSDPGCSTASSAGSAGF